jgi:chemotaxis protein MotB
MMTLLMVTFLMMFAISSLDLKKFQTFKEAFAKGTGTVLPSLPGEGVPTEGEPTDKPLAPADGTPIPVETAWSAMNGKPTDVKTLEALQKKVEEQLAKAGLADKVEAKIDARGLVLYVTSAVLFDSGEADVTALGSSLLDKVGPVLRTVKNPLVVEGHTDSRPISSSRYASNWELSAMRATAVARRLMDVGNIPRDRVSIAGYADTRPRKNASTEEAYALNRRVEIVVEAPQVLGKAAVKPPSAKSTPAPSSLPTNAPAVAKAKSH